MKTILTTLLLLTLTTSFAQFDDRFYKPSQELKSIEISNFEQVAIPIASDTLRNAFFKPVGKAKATILFFQGSGGNFTDYQYIAKPLVEAGYQVFMTSFRGYGKSTGKPTHLNIASDAEIIFDYLEARKDVSQLPMLIYGTSIGSQVAVNLTRKKQNQITALILDSAMSSFTDIAMSSAPLEQQAIIKMYVTSPYAAKDDIAFIHHVKILSIHSEDDVNVPYLQGKLVFDAANEPKTFYEYRGAHIDAMKIDSKTVVAKIDSLLPDAKVAATR